MRVLMTGGGTLGSIVPLVAVARALRVRRPDAEILFLITKNPAEARFLGGAGFSFRTFPAGKWRRYFDFRNVTDAFVVFFALLRALFLLTRVRPNVIATAGSFLSVPIVWAGWCLGIPAVVHQQDRELGLGNRLMAPFAKLVTVSWEDSVRHFRRARRVVWTGNPVRRELLRGEADEARRHFRLEVGIPTVLILGGSSGAHYLNELVLHSISGLTAFCNVLHVVGRNVDVMPKESQRYRPVALLGDDLSSAYAVADCIVTRAGLSTISEIAVVQKPCIVLPMPKTHQEANAQFLTDHRAAVVLDQRSLTPTDFVSRVHSLLENVDRRESLRRNLHALMKNNADEVIAQELIHLAA